MRKVIITCALTGGVQTKAANPNLPEQPDEIAEQAYECYNEGCAILISMHVTRRVSPAAKRASVPFPPVVPVEDPFAPSPQPCSFTL